MDLNTQSTEEMFSVLFSEIPNGVRDPFSLVDLTVRLARCLRKLLNYQLTHLPKSS
jgi:hypothetical protein